WDCAFPAATEAPYFRSGPAGSDVVTTGEQMTQAARPVPGHFYLSSVLGLVLVAVLYATWQAPLASRIAWLGGGYVLGVLFYLGAVRRPDWYWQTLVRWYHQLGSPRYFYRISGQWLPYLV